MPKNPAKYLQPATARERARRATAERHVYGYARVSTLAQAEDGESLDVQQRRIEGYAHMQGLALERIFIERGVSGSKPLRDRPQGAALLRSLQSGDTVIVPELDRVFRSALDAQSELHWFHDNKIELHVIGLGLGNVLTNSHAKMIFGILAAVAEGERDRIRERIAEVKRDQRSRGRYLGGTVPFGVVVGADGALVPDPEQATRHSGDTGTPQRRTQPSRHCRAHECRRASDQPRRRQERPRLPERAMSDDDKAEPPSTRYPVLAVTCSITTWSIACAHSSSRSEARLSSALILLRLGS
jgi:DNA invertase Pin-like site-specific DNA recombinase